MKQRTTVLLTYFCPYTIHIHIILVVFYISSDHGGTSESRKRRLKSPRADFK